MSKFNVKTELEMAVNEMGEKAFVLSDQENLVSSVLTAFVSSSYYETENEVVEKILNAANNCDPLFVAKVAVYARTKANMRSASHLLAGSLAPRVSGSSWGKRFYKKIVVRPDDISEILSYYYTHNKKMSNAMRKGFKAAFEKFDAYQLDKYKMLGKNISLIDIMNLVHPNPSQKLMPAYTDLIENKGKNLHTMYESKILEKEMSKAGENKKTETEKQEAKKEALQEVLANVKGMPIFNLLRNLRNIFLYAPENIDEACRQLTIENKVLKSRLLPFRFSSAYAEIEKLQYNSKITKSEIAFESERLFKMTKEEFETKKTQILDALEKALEISCQNIECLEGNTAILIDHSGSVRGDAGGSSRVSQFSKTTCAAIGNLFGAMLAYKQKDVYIGLFGNRLISPEFSRSERMLDFAKSSFDKGRECGEATENGLYYFLETCIRDKKRVDNLVIFSDMVIGRDGRGDWDYSSSYGKATFQELFKEFKKLNPLCNTVCVNIRSTSGKSVFNQSLRVLEVAGWSTEIFNIIKNNRQDYKAILEEINSIYI